MAQARSFDPNAEHYAPPGVEGEGFIHRCWVDQLGVLERYFRGEANLLLLTLDAPALVPWLKEEDSTGRGEAPPSPTAMALFPGRRCSSASP